MEYIHAGVSFMDGFTMTHQGRGTSASKCKIKCQLPVLRHASEESLGYGEYTTHSTHSDNSFARTGALCTQNALAHIFAFPSQRLNFTPTFIIRFQCAHVFVPSNFGVYFTIFGASPIYDVSPFV